MRAILLLTMSLGGCCDCTLPRDRTAPPRPVLLVPEDEGFQLPFAFVDSGGAERVVADIEAVWASKNWLRVEPSADLTVGALWNLTDDEAAIVRQVSVVEDDGNGPGDVTVDKGDAPGCRGATSLSFYLSAGHLQYVEIEYGEDADPFEARDRIIDLYGASVTTSCEPSDAAPLDSRDTLRVRAVDFGGVPGPWSAPFPAGR